MSSEEEASRSWFSETSSDDGGNSSEELATRINFTRISAILAAFHPETRSVLGVTCQLAHLLICVDKAIRESQTSFRLSYHLGGLDTALHEL